MMQCPRRAQLPFSCEAAVHKNEVRKPKTLTPPSRCCRGWQPTQAGTRSASYLLQVAPCVLQDMAVITADAVAAAYLGEAAEGAWSPGTYLRRDAGPPNAPTLDPTAGNQFGAATPTEVPAPGIEDGEAFVGAASLMRAQAAVPGQPLSASPPPSPSGLSSLEVSWWATFVHSKLASTRQLQRFINRLSFARWADRSFFSVAAAYEDRLPLFTVAAPEAAVRVRRVAVRRAAELARLTGLRYAACLVLEAADVAVPALRALWQRGTSALAWVLVHGIGWALGLVWSGVKMGAAGGREERSSATSDAGSAPRQNEGGAGGRERFAANERPLPLVT